MTQMQTIVGLHDRKAERIARREIPSLDAAKEIMARWTESQVHEIAKRGFADPGSLSGEEQDALLAYTRARFAQR